MRHLRNKRFSFILITVLISFPLFAQPPLSEELIKERQDFLTSQIPLNDKIILDQLAEALDSLSRINDSSLKIFNSFYSSSNKNFSAIMYNLQRAVSIETKAVVGHNKPVENIEMFIDHFVSDDPSLKVILTKLIDTYSESKNIQDYIFDDFRDISTEGGGSYYYYDRCLKSFQNEFGKSPQETLSYASQVYKTAAEFSKNRDLRELKKILLQSSSDFGSASDMVETQIIDRMLLYHQTWSRDTMLMVSNLTKEQFKLNQRLSEVFLYKIQAMPALLEPILPDFKTTSLDISFPDGKAVGKEIIINATIKNIGQLATGYSKAKITLPDGSTQEDVLPKLPPEGIFIACWKYIPSEAGENTFIVTANSDYKTWEFSPDNNMLAETIIIPAPEQSE